MSNFYRGRFAPSPTGPLHFGSLVAAVGSYCQAKSQGGEWLVRMEDLDPPREVPGAADDILRTLETYHLNWDGAVLYQSQRLDDYEDALNQLTANGHTFPCACTRKSIAANTENIHLNSALNLYPGTCRNGLAPGVTARSIRVRVNSSTVTFHDELQGTQEIQLDSDVGDFVVKRADGLFAYHLAVVVDDAFQKISEIVRGTDLLDSTPHHLYLQKLLTFQTPQYVHLPVAVNAQGEKLSKQTCAAAINATQPGPILGKALTFLGHSPDIDVINADPETLLKWAISNWNMERVPKQVAISA
ncbi:MAG: tRNA glutamyl-Q(34) synthetase GluQRS [Gammaproteobacteria bacterium]